jgi:RNA polymerase sigma-70 factor (ECF subfamily)
MTRFAAPDLVATALSGDAPAVERLISAVWPACFRLAASLLGDSGLAQDAAQEACVIVHRKVRTLRSPGAFDAWLYRIVTRESARVRRRHATPTDSLYEHGFTHDPTASLDIWRALAELSHPFREVMVLFYFDELKTEEIAGILRVPHATVRTRLARARERLRIALGDYAFDPQAPASDEVTQHAC